MSIHSDESSSRPSLIRKAAKDASDSRLTRELMKELVKLRKKRKIGQKPIADAIGVTQGRISQMENSDTGKLTMESVLVYAKTIGAVIVVVPDESQEPGLR